MKGVFLNLSNHPIAQWSEAQRNGARALGFGEVADAVPPLPMVPPEMDEAGVVALADEAASRAVAQGARAAFVAGEYTLVYALVHKLCERGVRCFATTSARDVVVTLDTTGASVKQTVFRFVRWREYRG